MTTPRGPSSKEELRIRWSFPVYQAKATDGRSAVLGTNRALPVEEAFAAIAGDDPRPLLVLRECLTCTGTDDALLTRQADNEKTMLMSRWFHCVKLPPDVTDQSHPFHALFAADTAIGDVVPHLFVALPDGSQRVDLRGDQSRTELWSSLDELLDAAYDDAAEKSLKQLARVLDKYDGVDVRIAELEKKLDGIVEKHGPESSKFKKVQKQLTRLRAERNDLRAAAAEISRLAFREREEETAGTTGARSG